MTDHLAVQSRRTFVVGATTVAASTVFPAFAANARATGAVTPEMFGAKGDGRTDDSAAFAKLSDAINANGGGTVVLRNTTYLVGTVGSTSKPVRLMAFAGCVRPLIVRGNGARLRCAAGQRYGVFGPDGSPVDSVRRRVPPSDLLRPYDAMISAVKCRGSIEISDIELDGNLDAHLLGGKYGDKGWQIPCIGVSLRDNLGPETLINIHAHHHALDGIYLDGTDLPTPGVRRRLVKLTCDANGRQGMSITGGHDYEISQCSFTRTGRGPIASAPAAGVDIEAERQKRIRNLSFTDCRFADNVGCGMGADSGDSAGARFTNCTFIGTTNWAVWPNKPDYSFVHCLFLGSIVSPFSSPDPVHATRFVDCTFSDDPAQSPTGELKLRKNFSAALAHAQNVLFERCKFTLTHDGVLPWSVGPIWLDCEMSQRSSQIAHTRGTFRGVNRITGPVDISSSMIEGTLVLNGKVVPKTVPSHAGGDSNFEPRT